MNYATTKAYILLLNLQFKLVIAHFIVVISCLSYSPIIRYN